jgi:hypothetical protein
VIAHFNSSTKRRPGLLTHRASDEMMKIFFRGGLLARILRDYRAACCFTEKFYENATQ